MENLIIAFNVVLPLMLCIMLGYFLARIGMIKEELRKGMNALSFKIFLPFYLFNSVYTTDVSAAFNAKLMIYCCVAMLAWFALLMFIIPRMEKENPKRGVVIQAMFRSNFALFGLPMAESLCGAERMGPTTLLIGVCVPLVNILAVICLETFRGGKPDVKKILRGIATNPLIIASVLGIAMNLLHIPFPAPVVECAGIIANANAFLAMLMIGVGFKLSLEKSKLSRIFRALLIRYSIAAVLALCYWFLLPFDRLIRLTLVILAVSPIGSAVPGFTGDLGGDVGLSCNITSLTILISIITIVTLLLCLL